MHQALRIAFVVVPLLAAGPVAAAEVHQDLASSIEALDCVLPMPDLPRLGKRWVATLRVIPAFEPEWWVAITRESTGDVRATVKSPGDVRIADQFERLSAQGGVVECERLIGTLRLSECTVTDKEVPALRAAADKLEKQRWPAKPNPGLVVDATWYEVRMQGYTDEARLLVQGPTDRRAATAKHWHPVVAWTEDLRRILASCEARR
jgi:hypothetical protein